VKPAPAIPGTSLVNAGDALRRWTNDRFLSPAHRVFNDSAVDRYSIPFFHAPNLNAVVVVPPTWMSTERPAKYPAAAYEAFSLEFLNMNSFSRQKYVGSNA
jgi:isopenicillin N synthase-like dioxygenase